jgi:hypothetical protein
MFIYADESGHSGKHIFNNPPFYFQAAILSLADTEPILSTVANKYIRQLDVDRLHANELKFDMVETIASCFVELLSDLNWEFHVSIIEKPYLSVTKFVDRVFDSFENKGVRWLWYNHELFRHTLCILFDEVLSMQKKKGFWNAYLKDNYAGICSVAKWALKKLDRFPMDQRLKTVATDGLSFALKYPEEITLLASRTKKSYRGHTPNMVGFSSLIHAIHSFCKKNNVSPSAFVHDSQSEFSSTMREYHNLFAGVRTIDNGSGLMVRLEETDYDLGKFSIALSKNVISLQACDLFLKLFQKSDCIRSIGLRDKFSKQLNPFYISRQSSEMIVYGWFLKLSNADLTDEQIQTGKEIIKKMEDRFFKERAEFESKKAL